MSDTTTIELTTIVDTHLAAYGEPDPVRRSELIARVWATDGALVDPPLDARGHGAISDMCAAVQAHVPGHPFRRTSGVDAHHDVARYEWELVDAEGSCALTGLDVATVGADGKLVLVTGFLGALPTREH